jgi:hypothetical protein
MRPVPPIPGRVGRAIRITRLSPPPRSGCPHPRVMDFLLSEKLGGVTSQRRRVTS